VLSALVATGQVAQITYHLNRAMDNGLTQEQAGEVLTQLAFWLGGRTLSPRCLS
jgi:4-carboxymuconolactone decarboxylase